MLREALAKGKGKGLVAGESSGEASVLGWKLDDRLDDTSTNTWKRQPCPLPVKGWLRLMERALDPCRPSAGASREKPKSKLQSSMFLETLAMIEHRVHMPTSKTLKIDGLSEEDEPCHLARENSPSNDNIPTSLLRATQSSPTIRLAL